MQRTNNISWTTQKLVDEEVKRFVDEGYQTAQKVIRENIDDLHTIAGALLEYETLTGDEIRDLLNGKPPTRDDGNEVAPKATGVPTAGKAVARKRPDAEPGDIAPEPSPGG